MYLLIYLMKLVFGLWQGGYFEIVESFRIKWFSFWIKQISILGQIIFRFESRIISNYVSSRSQANIIVGGKASKPIKLELKPDAGKQRQTNAWPG